jgi:hypothetical protein
MRNYAKVGSQDGHQPGKDGYKCKGNERGMKI